MTETEARMILIQIAQGESPKAEITEEAIKVVQKAIDADDLYRILASEYATLQREHAALLAEKGGEVAIAEALESPSPAEKVQP